MDLGVLHLTQALGASKPMELHVDQETRGYRGRLISMALLGELAGVLSMGGLTIHPLKVANILGIRPSLLKQLQLGTWCINSHGFCVPKLISQSGHSSAVHVDAVVGGVPSSFQVLPTVTEGTSLHAMATWMVFSNCIVAMVNGKKCCDLASGFWGIQEMTYRLKHKKISTMIAEDQPSSACEPFLLPMCVWCFQVVHLKNAWKW